MIKMNEVVVSWLLPPCFDFGMNNWMTCNIVSSRLVIYNQQGLICANAFPCM
jgi:hypothetical protein